VSAGMTETRAPLKITIVGHVDHGKSTLIGRLIHDAGALPAGKLELIQAMSARRGMPFEWAFLMDALQSERDQGITIDTTQIRLRHRGREIVVIDAPGHKEFLKNMITGAAAGDAAVLVIDAVEGVQEQTRRHGYLLHLLGVRQVAVVVNKMDLAAFDERRFGAVMHDIRTYLASIGVAPAHVIPISARDGDNIVEPSTRMPWYQGSSVLDALDGFAPQAAPEGLALRFPIQDVYKFDERRIFAGRIETGRLKLGDRLRFAPSGKTARVSSIEAWQVPVPPTEAGAGRSIGVQLDEPIFVERGEIAAHVDQGPAEVREFAARLFWLGRDPLAAGKRYKLKLGTAEHHVEVASIDRVIDVSDLSAQAATEVPRNSVAEVHLRARGLMALDDFQANSRTGRFVLVDGWDIAGGGIVVLDDPAGRPRVKSTNITSVEHRVDLAERWAANGHKSGILWLTGLSGSGKSTLAIELEQILFRRGWQVYVLDGDNVRQGLSADLGFSPGDRAENIRRIGEVAALFARAGMLVVTAFISPYRADRERVRRMAPELFHEVFVKADLATCERRDPKGLYRKARRGEIAEFTGISAPYEAPEAPELTIHTDTLSVEGSLERLADYVTRSFKG
jgi:bifunctional enzyme CysN/CysC